MARPSEPTMLLHLSRASFWLAALAAAWALVAPGQHETALTGVAGAAALVAFVLWRCALLENSRSFADDAAVPQPAVLTSASLVEAAAAIARTPQTAAVGTTVRHAVAHARDHIRIAGPPFGMKTTDDAAHER